MQVIFESRDPEGAQIHTLAVRRVRFAMRRQQRSRPLALTLHS